MTCFNFICEVNEEELNIKVLQHQKAFFPSKVEPRKKGLKGREKGKSSIFTNMPKQRCLEEMGERKRMKLEEKEKKLSQKQRRTKETFDI